MCTPPHGIILWGTTPAKGENHVGTSCLKETAAWPCTTSTCSYSMEYGTKGGNQRERSSIWLKWMEIGVGWTSLNKRRCPLSPVVNKDGVGQRNIWCFFSFLLKLQIGCSGGLVLTLRATKEMWHHCTMVLCKGSARRGHLRPWLFIWKRSIEGFFKKRHRTFQFSMNRSIRRFFENPTGYFLKTRLVQPAFSRFDCSIDSMRLTNRRTIGSSIFCSNGWSGPDF